MVFIGYKKKDAINRICLKFLREFIRKEEKYEQKRNTINLWKEFHEIAKEVNMFSTLKLVKHREKDEDKKI